MCNGKNTSVPSRDELINAFKDRGDNVYIAGITAGETSPAYEEMGINFMPILASRDNVNPFVEIKSLNSVRKQSKKYKIDGALIYGIKNHIAMAIGSKLGGTKKVVCVVNGSGNLFFQKGFKANLVKAMSWVGLKIAYAMATSVVFQNPDDAMFFKKIKLVSPKKIVHTNGSGVNADKYEYVPVSLNDTFIMVSRFTVNKGTIDFINAAEIVKEKYPQATFKLIGRIESTMSEKYRKIIEESDANGIVSYLGFQSNVNEHLADAMCLVHPSYYREGVPRSVLEAMSVGRPIITCNTPGCKETVIDKKNGFMVTPKSPEQLAEKMIWMIEHHEELEEMGKTSRDYVKEKFDIHEVNRIVTNLY